MWAIKFFDGEKAESISALAKVVDATLVIESHHGQVIDHWPLKDILFDPNHLDKKFLMVRHEAHARIQIIDQGLVTAIPQLQKTSLENLFTTKNVIAFGLLFLAAFAVFIFWGTKPLSRYLASKISYDTEKKYAEKLNYDKFFSVCPRSISEQDFISKLEKRVEKDKFFAQVVSSVQIINMPQSNAFTLPGGKIFITDSLIRDADSSEEILGVLAHEAGHYQQRHILQGVIRGSFLTLFLNFLTGDFSQFVLVDPNTLSRIVGLQFDRGLEKEADTYAVQTLKDLGIGSNGLIHFFEKMKKKSAEAGVKVPEFMSTHPADEVRVEYLQSYKTDTALTPLADAFKNYHCYDQ